MQGLDLLLVSKEERERMKRKRFEQRRKREQMWYVEMCLPFNKEFPYKLSTASAYDD